MKINRLAVSVLCLASFVQVEACTIDGKEGFLPENNFRIPVGEGSRLMTEERFNAVIDKVAAVYSPIISTMGAEFEVIRDWKDATVNAFAMRPTPNKWVIKMFGGLARHETVTEDGFALVVCHEIGHHVGGAPRKTQSWASNEGQSDYFGTLKCFRKVFEADDNETIVSTMEIPETVKNKCKETWNEGNNEFFLCLRSSMAGASLAKLLATLGSAPAVDFDKPDQTVVVQTSHVHPRAQCRLDTYFQGSLCEVDHNIDVSGTDEVPGTCHQSVDTVGIRPLCWFKPKAL